MEGFSRALFEKRAKKVLLHYCNEVLLESLLLSIFFSEIWKMSQVSEENLWGIKIEIRVIATKLWEPQQRDNVTFLKRLGIIRLKKNSSNYRLFFCLKSWKIFHALKFSLYLLLAGVSRLCPVPVHFKTHCKFLHLPKLKRSLKRIQDPKLVHPDPEDRGTQPNRKQRGWVHYFFESVWQNFQ